MSLQPGMLDLLSSANAVDGAMPFALTCSSKLILLLLLLACAQGRSAPAVPIAALEVACGLPSRQVPQEARWIWSDGLAGGVAAEGESAKAAASLGGQRFWRPLKGLGVSHVKARRDAALDSPVVFEIPKSDTVGQAGSCQLVDGILRLPIIKPFSAFNESSVTSAAPTVLGWVTLSAEQKGGPRFLEEVPASEIEARTKEAGHAQCAADDEASQDVTSCSMAGPEQISCGGVDASASTFAKRCASRARAAAQAQTHAEESGEVAVGVARANSELGLGPGERHMLLTALWAVVASLGSEGQKFLGVRQLAATLGWIDALVPRLPRNSELHLDQTTQLLQKLRAYTSEALAKSVASAGGFVLCAEEWDRMLIPLQLEVAALRGTEKAEPSPWALLHGLACAANATARSEHAEGPDLLQALWALLTSAEEKLLRGGSGGDKVLIDAIAQGRHGVAGASAENLGLVLWRLHSAVTAREALLCAGRKLPLDRRWPPSTVCPDCWKRCFRRKRFCWEPWAEQRAVFAAAEAAEAEALAAAGEKGGDPSVMLEFTDGAGGFVKDALPNEDAVQRFLKDRCGAWSTSTL